MFTNAQRQVERTGRYGTPRDQHLQDLVTQFQEATDEESKERIVANLANFAYDPFNYAFMRQLNILELFLDCITEPNEKLIEFGIGGICNSCADPANASVITQCGGIPLVIQCLSSPVKNTVNYALGALYYLCSPSTKKDILKPEVLKAVREYAAAGDANAGFSNLANAFLDKHRVRLVHAICLDYLKNLLESSNFIYVKRNIAHGRTIMKMKGKNQKRPHAERFAWHKRQSIPHPHVQ
uniref:Armadillo repeat-containing domain-containing protein n=1 Tax=Leersia perrieri TaxID=77586 RepID=A0A0D9XSV6_9ORYZ